MQALNNANFAFAIKAKLGPQPANRLPDVVLLTAGEALRTTGPTFPNVPEVSRAAVSEAPFKFVRLIAEEGL